MSFLQFEPHAPRVGVGVVVVRDNLEGGYLGGVLHMGADAGAEVVVADADQPVDTCGNTTAWRSTPS